MSIKAKVEGHPHLRKDMSNNTVSNTDREGYLAYVAKRERDESLEKRVSSIEEKLDLLIGLLKGQK